MKIALSAGFIAFALTGIIPKIGIQSKVIIFGAIFISTYVAMYPYNLNEDFESQAFHDWWNNK